MKVKHVQVMGSDLREKFSKYVKETLKDGPMDEDTKTSIQLIAVTLFHGFMQHLAETESIEDLDLDDIDLLSEA